ncbi:hypothetical protein DXC97_04230 [Lachnospiraceae bacterium TF09-5]|nr:hypothetical protein DXC97_04230 [Lachnospiraceae bacterium TF09-5]
MYTEYAIIAFLSTFFSYMGVDKKHRRRCPCPCRSPALPGSVSFLLPLCKVPYRGRFRSDNHAAVLRLQNTQPKDRRAYTPLTGILAERQEKGDGTGQRRRAAGTRTAAPMFFIYTPAI